MVCKPQSAVHASLWGRRSSLSASFLTAEGSCVGTGCVMTLHILQCFELQLLPQALLGPPGVRLERREGGGAPGEELGGHGGRGRVGKRCSLQAPGLGLVEQSSMDRLAPLATPPPAAWALVSLLPPSLSSSPLPLCLSSLSPAFSPPSFETPPSHPSLSPLSAPLPGSISSSPSPVRRASPQREGLLPPSS